MLNANTRMLAAGLGRRARATVAPRKPSAEHDGGRPCRSSRGRPPARARSVAGDQRDRVADHLAGRLGDRGDRRQHRHVGGAVVVGVADGQRPEVRRRPQEDGDEQHDRRPVERVGDGRPADEHRHGAGRAADDDVLAARALQPDRVDEDVEHGGREGEHGGEQVGAGPQHGEGDTSSATAKTSALRGAMSAGDERALLGARHQGVDVAVDVHVDGVGAAGGERAADAA